MQIPKRHLSLQSFIQALIARNELVQISAPVDPQLELAEIHRQVVQRQGPALLFKNVRGSSFPVATNLFGSEARLKIALGDDIEERLANLLSFIREGSSLSWKSLWRHRKTLRSLFCTRPKNVRKAPILDNVEEPNLGKLPFIQCWPGDGGDFLTLPMVFTEHPDHHTPNLGIYRMQRFSHDCAGLHWQIAKGGAIHYHVAEQANLPLPVTVYLGGPPALLLSAVAPLPENMSELLLTAFLMEKRLGQISVPGIDHRLIGACELALCGYAYPNERRLEGPFGDHYGYQDPTYQFPVFHCTKMAYRNGAIIPATVVGPPLQEDAYIGSFIQRLMVPFIRLLIPNIVDLYTYPETGFHSLCVVQIDERYEREALSTAFRLLGEGQLALTKVLLVISEPVVLTDFKSVLTHLLSHLRPQDVYLIPGTATDTLDPTTAYRNKGSKIIFLGTARRLQPLPDTPPRLPFPVKKAVAWTQGCLLIEVSGTESILNPEVLAALQKWPLVILVDDVDTCCVSPAALLWNAFTRFNPSSDIFFSGKGSFPICIDARTKPHYQKPLIPDEETERLVRKRQHDYFS